MHNLPIVHTRKDEEEGLRKVRDLMRKKGIKVEGMAETSMKLQDIDYWIEMVRKGKTSKVYHFLNRVSVPHVIMERCSDDEWLKILEFERRQEIERIKFFDRLKAERQRRLVDRVYSF